MTAEISDLTNLKGRTIGFQESDISLRKLEARNDFKKVIYKSKLNALLDLNIGKIDAFFCAEQAGIKLISKYALKNIHLDAEHLFQQEYAFATRKGNRKLITLLNAHLEKLRLAGKLEALSGKWLSGKLHTPSFLEKNQFLFFTIAAFLFFFSMALMFWSRSLKRLVSSKTESLKVSEEKYRLLSETASDFIVFCNTKNEFLYMNPASLEFTGLTSENYREYNQYNFIPEKYHALLQKYFNERITGTRDSRHFELELINLKGKTLPVEVVSNPIFTDEVLTGYIALGRDITERKKAEEALRQSERKLSFHLNNSPLATIEWDAKFTVTRWAGAAETIFGYTADETIGKPLVELNLVFQDDMPLVQNAIDIFLDGKTPFYVNTNRNVTKNGAILYCIWYNSVLRSEDGTLISVMSQVLDITERKLAEDKLKSSEKLFRLLFENSSVGKTMTSLEGNLIISNSTFAEMLGYTLDELTKFNFIDFTHPEDQVKSLEAINILLRNEIPIYKFEKRYLHKNGSIVFAELRISLQRDENGKPLFFITSVIDITDKKKMIDDLVIAKEQAEQSNKLKDAFMANMSHEIRTPLNGILGMTSIIKEKYSQSISPEEEKYFEAIDRSCDRIVRTVDLILNYSRIQVGAFYIDPKEINLVELCEAVINDFSFQAKTQAIELSFINKSGSSIILADQYSVTQVISNLLDNAIKFTKSGFVKLELFVNEQQDVILNIKDSGIGISDEYLPDIFKPYTQEHIGYGRAYEGVGLGLAMVKKILELNNATISVESKKGIGTVFIINFGKAIIKEPAPLLPFPKFSQPELPEIKSSKTILIVEDDRINLSTIRLFLTNDYHVLFTDSSDDVTSLLDKNHIDLILMDIAINGALDGLQLTKQLKMNEKYSQIPVLVLTAHAFEKDKRNAFAAGCNDFLAKPFTKNSLFKKIDNLFAV